jgi:proteasome accessory factor C
MSTAEKLQRLISIVAWIDGRDGATIDEVCSRFGISRAELIAQLEMANMIGAESEEFTDMPVEVTFEGDVVRVFLMEFHRPLSLTPAQGLALVAAGAGSAALPGSDPDGPLPRALAKLAGVLGIDPDESIDVDLGDADAAVLDELRRATEQGRAVAIDYWSAGRDDQTHRVVEPWRVFSDLGAWYLQGHCRRADGERIFRIDRIQGLQVLDEPVGRPRDLPEAVAYRAGAEDPRVVLDLAPDARWVPGTYPVDTVEDLGEGRLRVRMPAGAPAFLARLLLRLGPDARLVEVDARSGGPTVAADAARRVLARYAASEPQRS